jgi:DNA-binding transcriptional LysR family regulator
LKDLRPEHDHEDHPGPRRSPEEGVADRLVRQDQIRNRARWPFAGFGRTIPLALRLIRARGDLMDRLTCDRMFLAVIENGSFTAAAARMGISSGQASKLVARLESDLGVRLLNRTTRAVAPTEAGRAYAERLRPLLDEFEALDLAIRDAGEVPRGRLRLSVPLTFGRLELAPALNEFAARYPEIALDVAFSDRFVNLVDEGYDLAVRIGRLAESSLIVRRLCAVRIVVVGAPDYLARQGRPRVPEDVRHHACIIDTNYRDPDRWSFRTAGGEIGAVPVSGRLRYSSPEACVSAVEAGLGLACLPSFVVAAAVRTGRLETVLSGHEDEPIGLHVLYPHSRHLAAKVRVLVDFLAGRFRDPPPWEAGWR